jgi:single-strand DNA-binding protein
MNKCAIIGNLTRDPESRAVGDKTVCNFTVAVNRRKKIEGQPEADFFRVSAWGKLGENCQKYLTKGKKCAVTGAVSVHAYKDNSGEAKGSLEIFADDVEFLSAKGDGEQALSQPEVPVNMTPVETSDLPF